MAVPHLKQYVFGEKLGTGTYATVYKAFSKVGKREVAAVKCILKEKLNKVSTENLLTEIELLKTLKHENIVELKDFQWDDSYIYLIMEYCAGLDLSRFIHSRRVISEHVAKRIVQQLAFALQCMRSHNIVHMDIKPQNILLSGSENPKLKLADLGFAHYLVDGDVEATYLRGSLLYMAPEILTRRQYNERADLWSVGVVLYECLFGQAPFLSVSVQELQNKIADVKPIEIPKGSKLSEECRHLLVGLLQRDPDMRMSFEAFFAHPFVDLEHAPSSTVLNKAVALVSDAVKRDGEKDYASAVQLYCQALDYFVPAIHYEEDSLKKSALRRKVKEYMDRAEELKQLLRPQMYSVCDSGAHSRGLAVADTIKPITEDLEFSRCLVAIDTAHQKANAGDYKGALAIYEQTLESILVLTKGEKLADRREVFQKKASQWLTEAESIKQFVTVQSLKTEDVSSKEEQEEKSYFSACSIQ